MSLVEQLFALVGAAAAGLLAGALLGVLLLPHGKTERARFPEA